MKKIKIIFIVLFSLCASNIKAQKVQLYKDGNLVKEYDESEIDKVIFKAKETKGIIDGHEYVEIGGVKWATMNLGATTVADSPESSYGDYYSWAATETWYTSRTLTEKGFNFKWKSNKTEAYTTQDAQYYDNTFTDYTKYTKYNETDEKTELETIDDAATQTWGENWRTPTYEDFSKLYYACGGEGKKTATITATTSTDLDIKGMYKIPGNTIPGYTVPGFLLVQDSNHKVFFPASGDILGGDIVFDFGTCGYYMSSTAKDSSLTINGETITTRSTACYNIKFTENGVSPQGYNSRSAGLSVRPVVK